MVDYKADAEKYVEGLATGLIGKLGLLLMQEFQLLSGVRGEVVLLRDDAAMMNALLHMFSEADQDVVDHFVREWMKQVRNLVYDGEDCIDLFVHHISLVSRGSNFLDRAWDLCGRLLLRHRLGGDIRALRARAMAISERRGRYGVYGQALQPSVAFGSRVPMSSTPPAFGDDDPSQFVGMKARIESLSKLLANDANKKLEVCSIHGMGGVGKTTLALAVYRKLKGTFAHEVIVSAASHNFDASKDFAGIKELEKERYIYAILHKEYLFYIESTLALLLADRTLHGIRLDG
jgi:disease resistance protein RPM1